MTLQSGMANTLCTRGLVLPMKKRNTFCPSHGLNRCFPNCGKAKINQIEDFRNSTLCVICIFYADPMRGDVFLCFFALQILKSFKTQITNLFARFALFSMERVVLCDEIIFMISCGFFIHIKC